MLFNFYIRESGSRIESIQSISTILLRAGDYVVFDYPLSGARVYYVKSVSLVSTGRFKIGVMHGSATDSFYSDRDTLHHVIREHKVTY